ITSNVWFDHRGNQIASYTSGGAMSKMVFDGADRVTKSYITDGGAVNNTSSAGTILSSWSSAGTVGDDIVLQQSEYQYDADGQVLLTTTRQRFDDNASNSKGELINVADTTGHNARVSYVANYYDAVGRTTMTVNVGTNGGSVWSRPANATSNSRSDTVLITSYDYNAAGEVETVTDPRGSLTVTSYDRLGRQTKVVANYVNG